MTREEISKRIVQFSVFLFIICLFTGSLINISRKQTETMERGCLDLTQKDLTDDGNVVLKGEWEFYDNQLFKSLNNKNANPTNYIKMPSNWSNTRKPFGYGTFRGQIKVSDVDQIYGIKIPMVSSAGEVYINGKFIGGNGIVSDKKELSEGRWQTKIRYFTTESETIEIVVNISNYDHYKGGMPWGNILFGTQENINRGRSRSIAIAFGACGFIFAIGIYHFIIYINCRSYNQCLYFGFFCLIMALRVLITGESFLTDIYFQLPLQIHAKLEYLSISLGTLFFILHLANANGGKCYSNKLFHATRYFLIAYSVYILVTDLIIYSRFIVIVYLIVLYFTGVEIFEKGKRKEDNIGDHITFYASLVFILTIISDVLYSYSIINIYNIYGGILVLVLGNTIKMSFDAARNYRKIENWSNTLNNEVKLRTKELKEVNDRLYHIATRDPLTGLYNRQYLEQWISMNKENDDITHISLLYIDLDDFKFFNDKYGHIIGDMIIREFSSLIKDAVGDDGFSFRMGGDEFVVLMPNKRVSKAKEVAGEILFGLSDSGFISEGINDYIGNATDFNEADILTCSIGIVESKYYVDIHHLIDLADKGMMEAKCHGKNNYIEKII